MLLPRKKLYFISGTLIILLAVIFFIIKPTTKEIKAVSFEIQTQKKQAEDLYLQGQFLESTKKQYDKISSALPEPQKLFLIREQELSLITALENIAQKNNLEQKITLEEIKTKDNTPTEVMSLVLKTNGDYLNFVKYLTNLESLDYYININNLRILKQPNEENAVSAIINAQILTIIK